MGIRGSNMFQTTRSMVFADGILADRPYVAGERYSIADSYNFV